MSQPGHTLTAAFPSAPRSFANAGAISPADATVTIRQFVYGRNLMRGHVRKRGRLWAFVVELDRDTVTGKRRQRWVSGFSTKAEAERELRKRLHLLDEGEDAFPSEIAVREFITERC